MHDADMTNLCAVTSEAGTMRAISIPRAKSVRVLFYAGLIRSQTGNVARAARFLLRAVLYRATTVKWLAFMEADPVLSQTPDDIKRVLAEKIHRPFARRGLTVAGRAALLMNHYRIMNEALPRHVLLDMVCGRRFHLAHMKGRREGHLYTIAIRRNMLLSHQGELVVKFLDSVQGVSLASAIVNVTVDGSGHCILLISGMQGPVPEYKADIVRATHELSGLRPKRAVVEAVCSLASWLGAEYIVATGKANHVSQIKRKWRRKVFADYDMFWQELGLTKRDNGDYEMPICLPRRKAADVAAKKRKEWLARQVYLDAISADTVGALAALAASGGTAISARLTA
jgi:uncharacterized protein VirK/YbjX